MPGKAMCALLVAAATVAVMAGCGSSGADKTIQPADAQTLNQQLSAIQQAVAAGDCATAESSAQDFIDAVNQLPETTGADVKSALRTAGDNLKSLASDSSQCRPSGATGLAGKQPPAKTTTSAPTTTDTQTTTSTTSTTSTSTTSTKAPPPEGNGGGNEGDDGGSSGSGGGSTGGTSGGTGGTGAGGGAGKR